MNLRLVAIPRIVTAGETGDVAFDADTIGRRHKDQPEDFDCAGSYSQRSEQMLGLRSRQIAEERKNLRPTAAEDAVAGRHARLKFVVEFRDCADVACLQAERLQNPDWTSACLDEGIRDKEPRLVRMVGRGNPACAKWMTAAVSSPSRQLFAARSMLPSTEGEIALP